MHISASLLAGIAVVSLSALPAPNVHAQKAAPTALYTLCTFYPQDAKCPPVYAYALKDASPSAAAVRDAFTHYARYLKRTVSGLTDEDKQYLRENDIPLPRDLSGENQAGLHNVIHDPAFENDPAARRAEVNNFIGHAVRAELYCAFDSCDPPSRSTSLSS